MEKRTYDWRSLFYTCMILAGVLMFGNAAVQSLITQSKDDKASNRDYPRLSWSALYEQQEQLRLLNKTGPQSIEQYFQVLQNIDSFEGSARRAADEDGRFFDPSHPVDAVGIRFLANEWANPNSQRKLLDKFGEAEWERVKQLHPIHSLERLNKPIAWTDFLEGSLWWALAQVGLMPFMFIHIWIKVKDEKGSLMLQIVGGPMSLILAVVVWEWGLFKYRLSDPARQLVRASRLVLRFATLVIGAGLSVFTCTGKLAKAVTEEEGENDNGVKTSQTVGYTFSTAFVPKYLGTFGGAIFHDAPIQTQELTVTHKPTGWYGDVWNSVPLGQRGLVPNFARETDYTVGKTGFLARSKLNYNFYFAYINVYPLGKLPRGDDLNFSAAVGRQFTLSQKQTVKPYVRFVEAVPAKGETPKEGRFVFLGAQQSRTFSPRLSLGADASVNYDAGTFGFNSGWIARMSGSLNWKAGKHSIFQLPTFQTSTPVTHTGDGRRFHFLFGAGYAYSW